jgi:hypothetical protein
MGLFQKVFGSKNQREIKRMQPRVDAIARLESTFAAKSDAELRAKTAEFKQKRSTTSCCPRPSPSCARRQARARHAPLRRAADRRHGAARGPHRRDAHRRGQDAGRHPARLPQRARRQGRPRRHRQRLPGQARRRVDGPVYGFLGLSVGVIVHGSTTPSASAAYACDITYGTNNEFGFDYLRDNMKFSLDRMVQRGLHYAIVDEVDSILIDEARTPLIISGPPSSPPTSTQSIDKIIPCSSARNDYTVDEKQLGHAHRRRQREGREAARRRGRNLYLYPSNIESCTTSTRRCGPHAVQARRRLHRQQRRGGHHRRVHRPHDAGPALVRRPAPGHRGQGRREDPGGEPDPGLDHLPELFPHVQEAGGHDRHRRRPRRRSSTTSTSSTSSSSRPTSR